MTLGLSRCLAAFLASTIQIGLLAFTQPVKSASTLAAWHLGSDGVLKLRTAVGAKLQAYFQYPMPGKGARLWIDFIGEPIRPRTLPGSGPIHEIRLGKPQDGFTRFVIEFNKSILIDPKELKLIGTSPDQWELNLENLPTSELLSIGEGDFIKRPKKDKVRKTFNQNYPYTKFSDMPEVVQGRYLVVIDPGHGGPDVGAVGIRGLRETDVVLDISLKVAEILKVKGVNVKLTRTREIDLDLHPRVSIANNSRANAFISIHANASSNPRKDVNGIETFFFSGSKGFRLANFIQNEVLRASPGSPNRGVRRSRFYVIRRTDMPAALVETGFLTGRFDSSQLSKASHRQNLAWAISRGILLYLQNEGGR